MYVTDFTTGLTSSRVKELAQHYGKNNLPTPPSPSILKILWDQLTDFMVIALIVVTIVQFGLEAIAEGAVLGSVVVINVIIGFTQEYKANKAIEALMSLSVPLATVIRDGRQEQIDSGDLVPGDVVVLGEGDAVPADLRLVEVSGLEIIEGILTGESVPSEKNTRCIRQRTRKLPLGDCKGSAFMSTVVAKGRGKGIVVRIGDDTEVGKISRLITQQPHQQTNIQKKLASLGKWLILVAFLLCALVVVIGVAYGNNAEEAVRIGVSLAVSVIPEGLVAVTTGIHFHLFISSYNGARCHENGQTKCDCASIAECGISWKCADYLFRQDWYSYRGFVGFIF
jgi:Ca2+-transporting ATPase